MQLLEQPKRLKISTIIAGVIITYLYPVDILLKPEAMYFFLNIRFRGWYFHHSLLLKS
jgi:hypothetical protein